MKTEQKIPAIHPGEILQEEFLEPMGITPEQLAQDIGITLIRIEELLHGKGKITANIALRLGRYFDIAPQFWLNLQDHYDLESESDQLGDRLLSEVKISKYAVAA